MPHIDRMTSGGFLATAKQKRCDNPGDGSTCCLEAALSARRSRLGRKYRKWDVDNGPKVKIASRRVQVLQGEIATETCDFLLRVGKRVFRPCVEARIDPIMRTIGAVRISPIDSVGYPTMNPESCTMASPNNASSAWLTADTWLGPKTLSEYDTQSLLRDLAKSDARHRARSLINPLLPRPTRR